MEKSLLQPEWSMLSSWCLSVCSVCMWVDKSSGCLIGQFVFWFSVKVCSSAHVAGFWAFCCELLNMCRSWAACFCQSFGHLSVFTSANLTDHLLSPVYRKGFLIKQVHTHSYWQMGLIWLERLLKESSVQIHRFGSVWPHHSPKVWSSQNLD